MKIRSNIVPRPQPILSFLQAKRSIIKKLKIASQVLRKDTKKGFGYVRIPFILMSKEKDLKFLRENLTYIFQLLVTVKELGGKYRETLDPDLAKVFLSSIVRNYLLCVANLLDPVKDGRGNENISIYVLGDIKLNEHKDLINRIKTHRSKAIAHNDRVVMHQGDEYFSSYNLKPDEVENLFEYMLQTLEKELCDNFPREKVTKNIQEKLERLFRDDQFRGTSK